MKQESSEVVLFGRSKYKLEVFVCTEVFSGVGFLPASLSNPGSIPQFSHKICVPGLPIDWLSSIMCERGN